MQEITKAQTRVLLLKAKLREMQAVRNALDDDIYVAIVMIAKLEYSEARAAESCRLTAEFARRTCALTLTRSPETHPRKAQNEK